MVLNAIIKYRQIVEILIRYYRIKRGRTTPTNQKTHMLVPFLGSDKYLCGEFTYIYDVMQLEKPEETRICKHCLRIRDKLIKALKEG